MQIEAIYDPVEVEVHFGQRGMRPIWFVWQGRRRPIREVTCAWSEREGTLLYYYRYFSVTDHEALYELRFDVRTLHWQLTKIALNG
jgi:hypothetical protein